MIKINFNRLRASSEWPLIVLDLIMICLIVINLSWLLFDTLFSSQTIQNYLIELWPAVFAVYRDEIHADFVAYDFLFLSIFITELFFRWTVSVIRKEYHRWWFYPFVHWYDVLGCIPVGGFRFLRLLRLISIFYRLQKMGVIDVTQSTLAKFFRKYSAVVVEEVSDRVVVNVLDNVKDEIRKGNPLAHKIVNEVVRPREEQLAQWLGECMTELIEHVYYTRRDDVETYVSSIIKNALMESPDLRKYSKTPLFGSHLENELSRIVSQIVYNVVDRLMLDLHGDDSTGLLKEAAKIVMDNVTHPESDLNELLKHVLLDSLDEIIDEVKIQKWKLDESLI